MLYVFRVVGVTMYSATYSTTYSGFRVVVSRVRFKLSLLRERRCAPSFVGGAAMGECMGRGHSLPLGGSEGPPPGNFAF